MTEAAADDARLRRLWRWPAWLWLALVLALVAQQVMFWRAPRLDSDVFALLPVEQRDPLLAVAAERSASAMTRRVVVLLASDDWDATRRAVAVFEPRATGDVSGLDRVREDAADATLDFFAPHRAQLLTAQQREQLATLDDAGAGELALSNLYSPGPGGLGAWRDDPLGLAPGWWQARAGRVEELDGLASVEDADGNRWAILGFETREAAFRLDRDGRIDTALDAAFADAARVAPGLRELRAGVPLHAEAAAVRANWEMNTIGFGSLAAVIVLLWLAFRGLRPVGLVAVSLVIGWAAGVAATALVFGNVHLLTLVFGASLVGVAEDYGIHYFACRQGNGESSFTLMRRLLPALFLAWVTSALAYAALGAAPFPALRQMALFSAVGLVAAFVTVVCWFPWLDRAPHAPSAFARAIGATLVRWPRLRLRSVGGGLAALAFVAILAVGLPRLVVRDDLRTLQSSPPDLIAQQAQVGRVLGMASPAQFFLVRGDSAEQVLQREEALATRLDALVAAGTLAGYGATSQWVPSASRQAADAALVAAAEARALAAVAQVTGEELTRAQATVEPLLVDAWLADPASAPFRVRWLGQVGSETASIVALDGIGPDTDLAALARAADGVPGARLVDRTSEMSALLGLYRINMAWLLLAGVVAVVIALVVRYRGLAWRAIVPTLLAGLLTIAALALLGEPLQLFTVLALLILLGMGVDYGIFLIEHPDDGASWLAVCLGAASTLLAFGLLALSATPALHVFGLTLLFGIGLVWLLSPCFRPHASAANPEATA